MNTLYTLCITKACEFLLTPDKDMDAILEYSRILAIAETNPSGYIRRTRYEFRDYTAREMILLINELANKFREVYNQGAKDIQLKYINATKDN